MGDDDSISLHICLKFFIIKSFFFLKVDPGNSLAVQWWELCTFTVVGPGSIPGQETKILQAAQHSQKIKENKSKNFNLNYKER